MDYAKLELLLDIADTKNLSTTAVNFGYTQSAVSHIIKKLESEMGFSLLKRNNRGVELSRDAKTILPALRTAVAASRRLQEEIQAVQGIQRGMVTVGTYSSTAIHWLPAIIRRFQREFPDIVIQLREGGLEEIEGWMQEGSVDFGLLSHREAQSFSFLPLTREPLYAVFPRDYPLPKEYQKGFPVGEFMNHPFITSESGMDHDVADTLARNGVVPRVAFSCKDDHSIIAMVENGLGVSLLPALILQNHRNRLQLVALLPDTTRTLGIGIVSEEALSLSAKALIRMIQSHVKAEEQKNTPV